MLRGIAGAIMAVILVGWIYFAVAGRDLLRDKNDELSHAPLLSKVQGERLSYRFTQALKNEERLLPGKITSKESEIYDAQSRSQAWIAKPEGAPYSESINEKINDDKILLAALQRRRNALSYLREEVQARKFSLEITQLSNGHLVLLVKDKSKTIRDGNSRIYDFQNDEAIARCIIEGLAPVVFDKRLNPYVPINDIILVGTPRVVMPHTGEQQPIVAYKYRYPSYCAPDVVNWDEADTPSEVNALLRPTVWNL